MFSRCITSAPDRNVDVTDDGECSTYPMVAVVQRGLCVKVCECKCGNCKETDVSDGLDSEKALEMTDLLRFECR